MAVEKHTIAWYTSIVPLVIASVMTFYQIWEHLNYNPSHKMRKYMIRVILMVPIYAFESWLSLRFHEYNEYFGVLRELYEAYVVYSFFQFLQIYLKGEANCVKIYDAKEKKQKHLYPFCCLPKWTTGKQFYYNTKYGTFQYVYLRTTLALLQLILIASDSYDPDSFSYRKPYVYIVLINNFSQIWAIYCLALFYLGFHDELDPMKPVPKFMSIKLIVFFTFWQSVFLSWLKSIGTIKATDTYSESDIVIGLQDYIICWEMLLAAIAHRYVFKCSDFPADEAPRKSKLKALASSLNVADVLVPKKIKNKFKKSKPVAGAVLETEDDKNLAEGNAEGADESPAEGVGITEVAAGTATEDKPKEEEDP